MAFGWPREKKALIENCTNNYKTSFTVWTIVMCNKIMVNLTQPRKRHEDVETDGFSQKAK